MSVSHLQARKRGYSILCPRSGVLCGTASMTFPQLTDTWQQAPHAEHIGISVTVPSAAWSIWFLVRNVIVDQCPEAIWARS